MQHAHDGPIYLCVKKKKNFNGNNYVSLNIDKKTDILEQFWLFFHTHIPWSCKRFICHEYVHMQIDASDNNRFNVEEVKLYQ